MQIKKTGTEGRAVLSKISTRLYSRMTIILVTLVLVGVFFGMVASGFFITIDDLSSTSIAKEIARNTLKTVGLNPHAAKNIIYGAMGVINGDMYNALMSNPERIVIDIKNNDFQKLAYKREIALADGILFTSDDDYVPAKIRYNDQVVDVRLRLKGDWTDHLKNDKWSFRIKTKGDDTFYGMKTFSIQDPITRNYLNEWLFLKVLGRENLIALRYNFVDVTINGKHKGIYAVEEHFDKRLIEHNTYREGPIIRFNEDLFWLDASTVGMSNDMDEKSYFSSDIDAFGTNKVMEDPVLYNQFLDGKDLLESFRSGKLNTSDVFDVINTAKFFAIADLMGASHSYRWHNSRFYYNPVTSHLEPIGFDGNCWPINSLVVNMEEPYHVSLFSDIVFYERYVEELERVSQKSYIDDMFIELDEELQSNLNIIHRDVPAYEFSKDMYYNNQNYIRNVLNPSKGLNAYFFNSTKNETVILELGNIQSMPIEILGISYKQSSIFEPKEKTNILHGMIPSEPVQYEKIEFVLPEGFTWSDQYISDLKLEYKLLGHSRLRNETVYPWPHLSKDFLTNNFIRQSPNINDFDFLVVDDSTNSITVKSGNWELNRSLIIPAGYTVRWWGDEVTKIDLKNNATILSYSPIRFVGDEDHPIIITSSDSSGQGIVVMNADEMSILDNVIISNLSAPSQNGWQLTGAITFYESPSRIDSCYISENKAGDDMINIIRSEFEITNSLFKNSLSDTLDVDFGTGTISGSSFINSGNDALDFSGSYVLIIDSYINGTGDKGVSGGEASHINIDQMLLENCNIAIASKDQSVVNVKNINILSSDIGLTSYQKKSEFGPSEIVATLIDMNNVTIPYFIEINSRLLIDNKEIIGTHQDVYGKLYDE